MEQIDHIQAARVWQRVRGQTAEDEAQALAALIQQEWQNACTYLQLSRRFHGQDTAILHRLFEQEQAHCACLKGIYNIVTGKKASTRPVPPISGRPGEILRGCYARQMRNLSAYEVRARESEYAHVFSRLREQEMDHCRMVLQVIGNLGQN